MISIIIPTRNEEKIIEKTLSTLKNTITVPYELIVSDGNSTDKTQEIAKKYVSKLVIQDPKQPRTISEGRNEGGYAATYPYILFMDADCFIPNPDQFIQKITDYFEKNPKVVGLAVSVYVLPEMATWADKIIFWIRNYVYYFTNNILHIAGAPGECLIVRNDAFKEINGFRNDLVAAEDIDFFHRLSKVGNVRFSTKLHILHTGRRAHQVGWPALLWEWFKNTVSLIFFKKAASKEWTVVR